MGDTTHKEFYARIVHLDHPYVTAMNVEPRKITRSESLKRKASYEDILYDDAR